MPDVLFNAIIVYPSTYWLFANLGLPLSRSRFKEPSDLKEKTLTRVANEIFSPFIRLVSKDTHLYFCQFAQDNITSVPCHLISQVNQSFLLKFNAHDQITLLPNFKCLELKHPHTSLSLCDAEFRSIILSFMSSKRNSKLCNQPSFPLTAPSDTCCTVMKDNDHFLLQEEPSPNVIKGKATSPFVLCSVSGHQCSALADTGSEVTLVSSAFFDQLQEATKAQLPVLPVTNLYIKGVTGVKSTKVTRQTYLQIQFNGKSFPFPALIIPNVNSSFILGMDFFTKYEAKLDIKNGTLELDNGAVQVPYVKFSGNEGGPMPSGVSTVTLGPHLPPNRKVTVLADSHGAEMYNHLKQLLPSTVDLQVLYYPGETFNSVLRNVNSKNLRFHKDDILIVIAGSNNLSPSISISKSKSQFDLSGLKSLENEVIICEIFPRYDLKGNESIAAPINLHLRSQLAEKKNIQFLKSSSVLERRHFTRHGLHLNSIGKRALSWEISEVCRKISAPSEPSAGLQLAVRRITTVNAFTSLAYSEILVNAVKQPEPTLPFVKPPMDNPDDHHPTYDQIREKIGRLDIVPEEKNALIEVLYVYRRAFSDSPGLCRTFTAHLRLKNSEPFVKRSYPIPFSKLEAVRKEIQRMLTLGIIERSSSPYSNPIVPVGKKDGAIRVCLDARTLNSRLISDAECPELIDVILARFSNPQYISTLDCTASFWQILLDPDSRDPTSFNFEGRNYRFCRLPFGLNVSMQIFIKALDTVLGPETHSFLSKYVDDLKVVSPTFSEHLRHLAHVFGASIDAGITFKFLKCGFLEPETDFLGFILSKKGILKDPRKLEAISQYPKPTNVKALQAFLGLVNFYRKFHDTYSELVSPLFHLLRKDVAWRWGEAEEDAFNKVKQVFTEKVVLCYPIHGHPYHLNTDSSLNAISGELYQIDEEGYRRPIAYYSRCLTQCERRYTTTEQELLSIVACCQKFSQLILGYRVVVESKVLVETDHHSLTFLNNCHLSTGRLTRWALFLQQFNLEVKHVKGSENIAADTLSRYPPDYHLLPPNNLEINVNLSRVFSPDMRSDLLKQIPKLTLSDPRYGKIFQEVQEQKEKKSLYIIHDNALFLKDKKTAQHLLCIPVSLEEEVVNLTHAFLGHLGSRKVHNYLKHRAVFPQMKRKIKAVVKACIDCQQSKVANEKIYAPLIPVLATSNLALLSVDLFGPLPRAFGNFVHILVCLDVFSKYIRLIPLRRATAVVVTRHFISDFVEIEGVPVQVVADRGPAFHSKYWDSELKKLNIKPRHSSPWHPQSNPVERYMRTLGALFRIYCHDKHRNWIRFLKFFESCLNMSVNESTGFTPLEIFKGESPQNFLQNFITFPPQAPTTSQAEKFALVNINLSKSAARRQKRHGPTDTETPFKVGVKVLLKTHHLSNAFYGEIKKFFRLYDGPYIITRVVGSNAFELKDPKTDEIKGVYNLVNLRKLCE
ncbi:retrovirus-related Pol polyprotein from transposon gypsy [Bemisia tabaci]|uniref:retrovirus-related Pol polyprotein from transposon gypsy n=1 Tax=Bemisia tabaci TaxID=7038 RepID=UPI003B280557